MTLHRKLSSFFAQIPLFGVLSLLFGVWLMGRPYVGIWGDSILYTAQALNSLDPGILGNDIFFKYGSQGDFTLFPRLHAVFIEWLGIEQSAFVLTLFGKLIWFCCLFYFISTLTHGRALILGLTLILGIQPHYDGYGVFLYGESMLTSRIYAESLVLLSVGLAIRQRVAYAALLAAAALLLHPLIALAGMLFVLFIGLRNKGAIAVLACLLACLLLILSAAYIGISPFDRLFKTYDPAWLDVVEKRNIFVFINHWSVDALSKIGLVILLLLVNAYFSRGVVKWLSAWLALCGTAVLLISWIGTSVFSNVLITQLQPWRMFWFVQLCALAMLGKLALRLWKGDANQRILLILLGCSLLLTGLASLLLGVFAVVFYWQIRRLEGWQPTRIVIIALGAALLYSLVVKLAFLELAYSRLNYEYPYVLYATLSNDLVLLLLVLAFLWFFSRAGTVYKILPAIAGFAVLLIGLGKFDARSQRHIDPENEVLDKTALQAVIPKNATVFWPGSNSLSWLWLQRAHYVSPEQMAGVVFSREMSLEARRRQKILEPFGFDEARYAWDPNDKTLKLISSWKNNADATMSALCKDQVLDFVIWPIEDAPPLTEHKPVFSSKMLDVFSCQKIREPLDAA